MKIKLNLFFVLIITLISYSCKDDEEDSIIFVDTDRGEQQIIDDAKLVEYLQSHYYNSQVLSLMSNPTIADVIITKLSEGQNVPSGHTLLMDDVQFDFCTYQNTEYKFYFLEINQGGGSESPHISDDVRVVYSGNDEDGNVFDSTITPVDLDLVNLVPGWSSVLTKFKVSPNDPIANPDGTVSYTDYGIGVMFLPSGLSYFSGSAPGLSPFANLIFKFELYQFEVNDHDSDGVPSYLEDVDGNGFVSNIVEDNTDGDELSNFLDVDDDGDGVLTINEDLEPDTDLEVDSDGDGDPTNDIGDGDPTNDDTDGDGIPNYLDTDDNGSKLDDEDGDGIPDYIDNN